MAKIALKPNKKSITLLIILAAAIFFGCVLSYMAMAGKVKGVMAELDSKQKQVESGKQMAESLAESKLAYFDARAEIRNLESSVSTQKYVPTLLKQLENLGKSVDLKVSGVRPAAALAPPPPRKLSSSKKASEGDMEGAGETRSGEEPAEGQETQQPYDELLIELDLHGEYMDTLAFLHKLTSFPKIIAVNNVMVSPSGPTPTFISPELSIRMNVTAFVFKDGETAQDSAAPPMTSGTPARDYTKLESGNEAG